MNTNGIPMVYHWYTNGIPSTTIRNKKRELKKSRRASETLAYFFLVQTPNSILNQYQVVPMVYQVILFGWDCTKIGVRLNQVVLKWYTITTKMVYHWYTKNKKNTYNFITEFFLRQYGLNRP